MSRKPLIGLTPLYREYKEMDRSILGKSYTDSVQKAGGLPVIIPPVIESDDLKQLLSRLDGIVMTGGDDLNPVQYGESANPLTPHLGHPRREEHDRNIFEYIWENRVPTLAVCLGMQEVNVFLGGSLYQDIPAQLPGSETHKIGDWFEARHEVAFEADSLISKVTGVLSADTNSAHHQSVKDLGAGLKITGRCKDSVIESIEPEDDSIPLLAVQWHPESEANPRVGEKCFEWLVGESSSVIV